ncbi:MAG: hypothetical protein AAF146_14050, partial [Bacteroidota bacterium]
MGKTIQQDVQVKIRGHRIELGEVEAGLLQVAGLLQAAVLVQQPDRGPAYLRAFVTGQTESTPSPTQIKEALSTLLPTY